MPTYNVMISLGYVEDSSNASFWFNYSPDKKRTEIEVYEDLKNLFVDFVRQDEEEGRTGPLARQAALSKHNASSCKKKKIAEDATFCPACGMRLKSDPLDDEKLLELVGDFVRNLMRQPCVEVDQNFVEFAENRGWHLWGSPVSGKLIQIASFDCSLEQRWGDQMDLSTISISDLKVQKISKSTSPIKKA